MKSKSNKYINRALRFIRNAILGTAVFGATAAVIAGTATAQTAPAGYDNCPSGMSRNARLYSSMTPMPGACRLSQCKPYDPPAYAGRLVACSLIPGLPAAGQVTMCLQWLYQALPGTAVTQACPVDVQNGGTTGWVR